MPSTATTAPIQGKVPALEANRAIAVDFLKRSSSGRAKDAMQRYATPDFVHHNPHFAADGASLAEAMEANARANPAKLLDVQRTVAEGALVVVHSKVRQRPDDGPVATVHIFRFEDGRIAELWDVAQAEPPDSPNLSGMF